MILLLNGLMSSQSHARRRLDEESLFLQHCDLQEWRDTSCDLWRYGNIWRRNVGLTKLVTDEALNKLSPLEEGEFIHLNALNQI